MRAAPTLEIPPELWPVPDIKTQLEELRSLVNEGPGMNKRAYGRVLAVRRTLYVAAATEEQCRYISRMVRSLRRWFSDEGIGNTELTSRRNGALAAVADVDRVMSQPASVLR